MSAGCQSTYGSCDNATGTADPGSGGTSTDGRCGPGLGTCGSNQCCSLAGYCGTTEGRRITPFVVYRFAYM